MPFSGALEPPAVIVQFRVCDVLGFLERHVASARLPVVCPNGFSGACVAVLRRDSWRETLSGRAGSNRLHPD